MRVSRLTWVLLAALAVPVWAQTAQPVQTPKPAPTLEQVKQDPDNKDLLNAYVLDNLRAISTVVRTQPDAAEKKLAEFEKALQGIEPKAADARQMVDRARNSLKFYRDQIELGRTSLGDLQAKVKASPEDVATLNRYVSKLSTEVSTLVRSNTAEAEKQISAARAFLGSLKETAPPAMKTVVERGLTTLTSLERTMVGERKREELVGKKAMPLAVETWLNGSPLTDADLKGKVVFLDFWAVWCGPCIATFPHLREWNAKYADKGLVMIGLTKYYNYDWDEAKDQAARSQDKVTPEREQAMMMKFGAQHQLAHRFAVQKENQMADFYGVTGIPQVVIIDREGVVRLIKVGSGEANAQAIGEMLEKLLGGPAGQD